ncbi:MAG: hypothetical protein WDN28_12735 [Chthoniobacter sp.]
MQAIHDHAFLRLQAIGDRAQAAEQLAQQHLADAHGVVGFHDHQVAFVLLRAHRDIRHEQGLVRTAACDPHLGEEPGCQGAVRVRDHPAQLDRPGIRVHVVIDEIDHPFVWVILFIFQLHEARDFRIAHALALRPLRVGLIPEKRPLRHGHVAIHRVDGNDRREQGRLPRAAIDQVAHGHIDLAHPSVDRRRHARPIEIQLRGVHGGLVGGQLGIGPIETGLAGIVILLRDRLLLNQILRPAQLRLGQRQLRLVLGEVRLLVLQVRLERAVIDHEEQIALLDQRPFLERRLLDDAADPRRDIRRLGRNEVAGKFVPIGHLAVQRKAHGDQRRRRSGRRRLFLAARHGQQKHQGAAHHSKTDALPGSITDLISRHLQIHQFWVLPNRNSRSTRSSIVPANRLKVKLGS